MSISNVVLQVQYASIFFALRRLISTETICTMYLKKITTWVKLVTRKLMTKSQSARTEIEDLDERMTFS